jgi:hypothetical protein
MGCARLIAAHRSGSRITRFFHNRAAFLAYQRLAKRMRLIFGMIVGAALTVGGAYVADPNRIGQLGAE